jgi:hypothetical protein
MTFLQPFILWGLPLILLPVLIHLINRMRHRTQPWAAMRFLLSATRHSVSHAKLKQFLILLFRVLAVLMLVLFLSRPLAGGWLGWALSSAPDAVLILVDRSASMEARIAGTTITKREHALTLLSDAAREFEETSHLILIDSALRAPQQIARASTLHDTALTGPTDTAADIPAMLQSAVNWLVENRAGVAEIWIASDMQRSNWQPEDPRLKTVAEQLESLPQKVRVRLLALNQEQDTDVSLSISELVRRNRSDTTELHAALDLQTNEPDPVTFPLTASMDGEPRFEQEIGMSGQALRWRHRFDLGPRKSGGWGKFEIPADANRHNNTAYFVFGAETPLRATVISAQQHPGRFLQLAAGASARPPSSISRLVNPAEAAATAWDDNSLIVWQSPLPQGETADRIRKFVAEGGVAIFFPPGVSDGNQFNGLSWGELQSAGQENTFRIARWDQGQGPLSRSDEGLSLPVSRVEFSMRQNIVGPKSVLAGFTDGAPFLARQSIGRGEIYFCASLPDPAWSSLDEGPVLVPMLQRLLMSGSRRLQQATMMVCGELGMAEQARNWTSLDSNTPKDIRLHAGVYQSGERLVAVNRPAAEDDPELLDADEAGELFAGVAVQTLQERQSRTGQLQGEIWRVILFVMLLFLIVEGLLILPSRPAAPVGWKPGAQRAPAARELETVP